MRSLQVQLTRIHSAACSLNWLVDTELPTDPHERCSLVGWGWGCGCPGAWVRARASVRCSRACLARVRVYACGCFLLTEATTKERAPPGRHVDGLVDQQLCAQPSVAVAHSGECPAVSRWWRDHVAAADDDAAATAFDLFVPGQNADLEPKMTFPPFWHLVLNFILRTSVVRPPIRRAVRSICTRRDRADVGS